MLLNIYLGTTAASIIVTLIYTVACEKKLKRMGYKFKKEKKSFFEKVTSFLSNAFLLSIPIYNIVNTIAILCTGDKLFEHVEDTLLEKEEIYKLPEEDLSIDNEVKVEKLDPFIKEIRNDLIKLKENPYSNSKEDALKFQNLAYEYLKYKQSKPYTEPNLTMVSESDFYEKLIDLEDEIKRKISNYALMQENMQAINEQTEAIKNASVSNGSQVRSLRINNKRKN